MGAENESHASSSEVFQVHSSKPLQALGEILGDVYVSVVKRSGESVFSPEDDSFRMTHDTSVNECPPETGATALSPHLVDAGGHRSVVPVENMSDAIIASGLMEETIMQPMTENGESNPEDVASASSR